MNDPKKGKVLMFQVLLYGVLALFVLNTFTTLLDKRVKKKYKKVENEVVRIAIPQIEGCPELEKHIVAELAKMLQERKK